ncbi:Sas10/Utp3/C1D family [Rhizoctonia solani]|uniref:Sas10/Utp3/C1D family n=1 Tax=Rhizoctonia solani TaxID=456999 RepID=A0A8H7I851_9AGAM|nr:Sas10/Utp3/C1D family [Rhizoctonia solani]
MTDHLSETVDDLVSSIDELEDVLAPLLAETAPTFPLKDRVKSYFAKIKEAENPAKRTLAVDGKVANRFIKHALSSAISQENFQSQLIPTEVEVSDESSSSDEEPAAGTWKAKKRDREVALAANKVNQESSDDEDEPMEGWEEPEMISSKIVSGDGPNSSNELLGRQKRPKIDPFAGYDGTPSKPSKPGTVIPPSEPELRAEHSAGEDSDTSSPSPLSGLLHRLPHLRLDKRRLVEQEEGGDADGTISVRIWRERHWRGLQ